jgi:hypothetical protein
MENEIKWEVVITEHSETTRRLKVEGGHLYRVILHGDDPEQRQITMCFVPDVDLSRYQAHLREAHNQGFADGLAEAKIQRELMSEDQWTKR